MQNIINNIKEEISAYIINSEKELALFKKIFLSKKGKIKSLFQELKKVDEKEEKKAFGLEINLLKNLAEKKIETLSFPNASKAKTQSPTIVDTTAPGISLPKGSTHPIYIVQNQIVNIFKSIGFTVSTAPEIEDDWHVFSALNIPEDHPAKDMQDTFFIGNSNKLLRSHTSSVQVRMMENYPPPIRTISPGRVYRNETISARSHSFFNQIEGLYIDNKVSFSDLKAILIYFIKNFFGENVDLRLRSSYFPFTEPSAEVDISCTNCQAKGCYLCKHTGFLEILGCGMVDPQVLKNCNINPNTYTGYAFGMGIERITMLKYNITDIRTFSENDVRFLNQFTQIIN